MSMSTTTVTCEANDVVDDGGDSGLDVVDDERARQSRARAGVRRVPTSDWCDSCDAYVIKLANINSH